MSGAEATRRGATPDDRAPTRSRYGTIIVCGGGCYGSYYVRQLRRAAAAGVLAWDRALVVDRNPVCRVAKEQPTGFTAAVGAPIEVVTAEWGDFFGRYLGAAVLDPESVAHDAIVPSPLMPHLMYEWVLARARQRWPGRVVETRPLPAEPPVPWQRGAPDGTHYVSFAEWICPINCIEPAKCPVTRGPRSWSLPPAIRAYVEAERARGRPLAGPAIIHCVHRAFGVGMFDTSEVLAADALAREVGTAGTAEVLVGTVSHCHGALNLLAIGPT